MKDNEFNDVLIHLRGLVQESKLRTLDNELYSGLDQQGNPRSRLINYLNGVISLLKENSSDSLTPIIQRLNQHISVEGGGNIEGIEVELGEADAVLYEQQRVSLNDRNDYSGAIFQLNIILNSIPTQDNDNTPTFEMS